MQQKNTYMTVINDYFADMPEIQQSDAALLQ